MPNEGDMARVLKDAPAMKEDEAEDDSPKEGEYGTRLETRASNVSSISALRAFFQ